MAALLADQGLGRYYQLTDAVAPAATPKADRSHSWLDPVLEDVEGRGGPVCRVELDVQGVHCAACVWLMGELFQRREGALGCTVNPAVGKITLAWRRGTVDVRDYLRTVEKFGYAFGPSRKESGLSSDLAIRIGLCTALTMNTMMFSAAFYTGLAPRDGLLYELFSRLSFALTTIAVAVGGWPFFRSAIEGLRRRVLHLDLPIALGIVLVYATSILQAGTGRGEVAYFDTLDTFITLMLVGRWMQERWIERNRSFLLADAGADAIHVRRVEHDRLVVTTAPTILADDVLQVAPGELVPVDGVVLERAGRCSLNWITGEPEPRDVNPDDVVPAGAFNAGDAPLRLRARTDFASSPLPSLLRATHQGSDAHAVIVTFVTRWYVPAVLALSAGVFATWRLLDPARALDVTVSLLVVTCPCAIGLAVPLAYELAFASLRRKGVYVRAGDLLDRLRTVRKLLLDKTGTVTLSQLELVDPAVVRSLSIETRDALYAMSASSRHPVGRCLTAALEGTGAKFAPGEVREVAGQGMALLAGASTWRLGRAGFALAAPEGFDGTWLSCDGVGVARFEFREQLRPGSRRGIEAAKARGLETWLVSGDERARVLAAAGHLGIALEHVLAEQKPEDKAAAVERLNASEVLFIGDGVNDALAFSKASCAGTPAVDQPVMPGKADFFLPGDGLDGLVHLFEMSDRLKKAVDRNLALALAYNVLAVIACYVGWMTPLRASIAMPLSSLTVLALTAWSMREGTPVSTAPVSPVLEAA